MLYRKAPPQPPRLLLRIAAASTSVLLGTTACGGAAFDPGPTSPADDGGNVAEGALPSGVVARPGVDAAADHSAPVCNGFCTAPPPPPAADASHDGRATCGNGLVCGIIAMPTDAGHDADAAPGADAGHADAAQEVDAGGPCPQGFCGVVIMPDATAPEDASDAALTCGHGGFCGVMIGIMIRPDQ